jgi:hypothetical protein
MKGNSGHTSKANFGSDICEFESSHPDLTCDFRVFSNSGRGVKLSEGSCLRAVAKAP